MCMEEKKEKLESAPRTRDYTDCSIKLTFLARSSSSSFSLSPPASTPMTASMLLARTS